MAVRGIGRLRAAARMALAASGASAQQADLSWSGSYDTFILQRAEQADFSDAKQIYAGTGTSFVDTGLTASTTYYYRVYGATESTEAIISTASATTEADGGSLDTDAYNYLQAAGITDSGNRSAVNTFVLALKADGLWTNLVSLQLGTFGGVRANSLNVKNPAFSNEAHREQYFGAVTHNASDITFAGVPNASEESATVACATNYLIPSESLASAAKTYFFKITASTTNRWNFGAEITATNLRDRLTIIGGATADQAAISSAQVSSNFYSAATVDGEWFFQRSGAADTDVLLEKDGSSVLTTISAETGGATTPIATSGYTTNSPTFNPLGHLNQSRNCFAAWSEALDGTKRGDFRTHLATLLAAL